MLSRPWTSADRRMVESSGEWGEGNLEGTSNSASLISRRQTRPGRVDAFLLSRCSYASPQPKQQRSEPIQSTLQPAFVLNPEIPNVPHSAHLTPPASPPSSPAPPPNPADPEVSRLPLPKLVPERPALVLLLHSGAQAPLGLQRHSEPSVWRQVWVRRREVSLLVSVREVFLRGKKMRRGAAKRGKRDEPIPEPGREVAGVEAPLEPLSSAAAAALFAARMAANPPPLPMPGITETGCKLDSAVREAWTGVGAEGGARRAGAGAGLGLAEGGTSWRYWRGKESVATRSRTRAGGTHVGRCPSLCGTLLDKPPTRFVLLRHLDQLVLCERHLARLIRLKREESVRSSQTSAFVPTAKRLGTALTPCTSPPRVPAVVAEAQRQCEKAGEEQFDPNRCEGAPERYVLLLRRERR